jgi:hypothetical protein
VAQCGRADLKGSKTANPDEGQSQNDKRELHATFTEQSRHEPITNIISKPEDVIVVIPISFQNFA